MSLPAVAHPSTARLYGSVAAPIEPTPTVMPAGGDLDATLRWQRLWLVRVYSAGIAFFGLGWCVLFLAGTRTGAENSPLVLVTTAHAAVLGIGG